MLGYYLFLFFFLFFSVVIFFLCESWGIRKKVCQLSFSSFQQLPYRNTTWLLKRYYVRGILTRYVAKPLYPFALSHGPSPPHRFAFPPSSSLGRSRARLLPSRTGCPCWSPRRAKQWRDVAHENGYAFVLGNCLSFCYFAASKSQTSSHRSTPSRKRPRRFLSSIYFVFRFYTWNWTLSDRRARLTFHIFPWKKYGVSEIKIVNKDRESHKFFRYILTCKEKFFSIFK